MKIRKHRLSVRLRVILILLVLIVTFVLIDSQLRPSIETVVANKAKVISSNVINQVVMDEISGQNINYFDFISIERNKDGKVLSITTDVKKVNLIKSNISLKVQEKILKESANKLNIPLGTIFKAYMFNGRGPSIPFKFAVPGSVETELKSDFISAGINQTKHQIYINVHTDINALIPGYPTYTTVSVSVPIAETVIVGEIPEVFANFSHNQ